MKNYNLTPEILESPTTKEYFVRFFQINSVNKNNDEVKIVFSPKDEDMNERIIFCDKVKVGEKLENAVVRVLKNQFGLELIRFEYFIEEGNKDTNKKGEIVPTVSIRALVKFKKLRNKKSSKFIASWFKIPKDIGVWKKMEAVEESSVSDIYMRDRKDKQTINPKINDIKKALVDLLIAKDIENPKTNYVLIWNYPWEKSLEIYKNTIVLRNYGMDDGGPGGPNELLLVRYEQESLFYKIEEIVILLQDNDIEKLIEILKSLPKP